MQTQTRLRRFSHTVALVGLVLAAPSCILAVAEPEPPPQISVVQGAGQAGEINQALPMPIVLRAVTAAGRPVPSHRITFLVSTGGGSVTPVSMDTNSDGEVSIVWTLGPQVATQTITANSAGVGPVTVQAVGMDAAPLLRADLRATP